MISGLYFVEVSEGAEHKALDRSDQLNSKSCNCIIQLHPVVSDNTSFEAIENDIISPAVRECTTPRRVGRHVVCAGF
jgi:hypothetical protein